MQELPCQRTYRLFVNWSIVPKFTTIFTLITLVFSLLVFSNVLNHARTNFEDTFRSRTHCFTKFLRLSISHIANINSKEDDEARQIKALLNDAETSKNEIYQQTEIIKDCRCNNVQAENHFLSFLPTDNRLFSTCFSIEGKTYKNYFSPDIYQKKFYQLEKEVLGFFFAGFLIYFIVVYVVFRKILNPLSCLANEMKNVSLGTDCTLASLPENGGDDEIHRLFRAYCQMLNQLKSMHEEQLQTSKFLIETEKFVTIGQLVAGLAHEINNPLGGMKNCLYNLKKKEHDQKKMKYIDLMENGVDLISNLIQRLLNLSNAPLHSISRVNLKKVLEESLGFLKTQLHNNQITLQVEAPDNLEVMSNKYSLVQIFLNLTINAIDALKEKETTDEEKILAVKMETEEESIVISFFDNGIGVEENLRDKIFEPFFTTKSAGAGSGLGLFIIDGIVSALNYPIELSSEWGQWTKITIRIPIREV
ncbi:MAG: GHKL domain-containing protein [Xanthomonadaceae bacterium]|nr:GHKL domain-containing protein [Xanthomonadaceae bacterium]